MTTIYLVLGSLAAVLAAVAVAFFKGKSDGKEKAEADQKSAALDDVVNAIVKQNEIKIKVQESDNAANSQDRAALIESLSADSVRKSGSR